MGRGSVQLIIANANDNSISTTRDVSYGYARGPTEEDGWAFEFTDGKINEMTLSEKTK